MTRVTGILAAAYQRGGMDRTDAEDAARKSVTLALRYGIDVPVDGFTPAAEASMGDTVAKAVDDHPGDTERLMRYWSHGEGAAKIGWGVPGDFDRCRAHLGKYVHDPHELAGLCANLHHRAIGVWPGEEDGGRGRHKSAGVDVPGDSVTVTKVGPHGYIHDWIFVGGADMLRGKDASEYWADHADSWYKAHPPKERPQGYKDYLAYGYGDMNGALRTGKTPPPAVQARLNDMDALFSRPLTTDKPVQVRRYVSNKGIGLSKWKPGETFTENGYLSTTVADKDLALPGVGNSHWTLNIDVPPGSSWLPGSPVESEMIFPRGSVYHVSAVDPKGRQITLALETPTRDELQSSAKTFAGGTGALAVHKGGSRFVADPDDFTQLPAASHPSDVLRSNRVEEADGPLEKWDPLQPRDWHGRWSPASHEPHADSHAARNLVDSLQEPDSGFSKHFDGTDAEHGSMVAVAGHTLQIDGHVPTIDELQAMDDDELESELTAWIGRNRQYFRDPSMFVGGWHDPATGKVFFDVAQNVTDREAAIRMGRSRGEISIYDIDAGRTFDTGGTGMRDEVPR